jgi:AcrR family transcriptional regulator
VFERKVYAEVSVRDITREAQVAHGTFYTYFDTKEAIFAAVCQIVVNDMLDAITAPITNPDFHGRVHDAILRYVRAYRPNAKIIGVMEQVGFSVPELRSLRLDVRRAFIERTERGIRRMQTAGLADAELDVAYTAEALGAMIEYTCYMWFTLDHEFDEERLIDALAGIWEKALQPHPSP